MKGWQPCVVTSQPLGKRHGAVGQGRESEGRRGRGGGLNGVPLARPSPHVRFWGGPPPSPGGCVSEQILGLQEALPLPPLLPSSPAGSKPSLRAGY